MSTGGMFSKSTTEVVKTIALKIASKSMDTSKDIAHEFKTQISMSFIKSRVHCLRASKNKVTDQMSLFNSLIV